jgi:hypothetical protein
LLVLAKLAMGARQAKQYLGLRTPGGKRGKEEVAGCTRIATR